jgi:signal transduction histidine kinase
LEKVWSAASEVVPVDFDVDGKDELVYLIDTDQTSGRSSIVLYTKPGNLIDQVNYAGAALTPHFLDYDGDGRPEMLVPFVRNDSLFVSFVNRRGKKLFYFFLIDGQPRWEDDGFIPWDPRVQSFYMADVNSDGRDELVTVLSMGLARQPRGVLVNSLPDGRLLGKKVMGAPPDQAFFGDFDGDGSLEIVVATGSPNNGAVAGGFDDAHTYLIVFELTPEPEVRWWKQMGGLWSNVWLFQDDFDGDGKREFLAVTSTRTSRMGEVRLELIEPGTWRTLQQRPLLEPLKSPQVLDLDRDARPEILLCDPRGEIWILNGKLNTIRRQKFPPQLAELTLLPDVDGDGIKEIIAWTPDGSLVLGPDLGIEAVLPGMRFVGVVKRGLGNPPYLLTQPGADRRKTTALRLVPNRLYLVNRYGPASLPVLGVAVVVVVVLVIASLRRNHRLLRAMQALALDTDHRGLMLLTTGHDVKMMNSTLRRWLGLNGTGYPRRLSLGETLGQDSPLVSFLRDATALPARRRSATLTVGLGSRDRTVRVDVEPLPAAGAGALHWLVILEDRSEENELVRARTWGMMAQRVAHDIKNPLTSILLTLQRLQMEYRERTPEAAGVYDSYAVRIIERIEYLRRVTRSFMKFVYAEELSLTDTDMTEFIQSLSSELSAGLPPDIDLELKLSPDLPVVKIDQEQIQSVLENLVANAVNAMPNGGRISISTQLEQGLLLAGSDRSVDYVVMEVLDTGVGIPESVRDRLFEPDFTSSESGTGLGLAIVKKIVEDHGGHIEVESEEGVGSAFSIYLPVAR